MAMSMAKMGTTEDHPQGRGAHKVNMMNRRTGSITGVSDVISFDISEVLLETDLGMMQIKGADLHVNRLTLEKGRLSWRAGLTASSIRKSLISKKRRISAEPAVPIRR